MVRSILRTFQLYPHDVVAWRNNSGQVVIDGRTVRFGMVGSSDILCVTRPHGRLLAIECKSPRGKLTEAQHAWLAAIARLGGYACVVRSVPEAVAALQAARAGHPAPLINLTSRKPLHTKPISRPVQRTIRP